MDLNQLQQFEAVANEKSFTRAAEKLFLTQPAMSFSIKSLEKELNYPLFDRVGKKVVLTEAGEILLRYKTVAFEALDRAKSEISQLSRECRGIIKLGVSESSGIHILPPYIKTFREKYPQIEFKIQCKSSRQVIQMVTDGEVDLGFLAVPDRAYRSLVFETIWEDKMVLIGAPTGQIKHYNNTISSLEKIPLILLDRETTTYKEIMNWFNAHRLKPRVIMEIGNLEAIRRLVELDLGCSLMPRRVVASKIESGDLMEADIDGLNITRNMGICYRRERAVSKGVQEFFTYVKDNLSSLKARRKEAAAAVV